MEDADAIQQESLESVPFSRESILDEAKEIVSKDRQSAYGTPEKNLGRIAVLWSSYLEIEVKPHDVAALMALLKIARIKTSPERRDSGVDLCGYAAVGAEVAPR